MTAIEYNEINKELNDAIDKADLMLKGVIAGNTNELGLVNDDIKKSEPYIIAKNAYNKAFENARIFRSTVPNKIKRDASKIRRGF